jgi:DNA (cytosine-5)-methyltransferase 1
MTKPPYRLPSIADVRAVTPCGLRVLSLFSGCGGSCLGFRLAGFRVVYANEFIASARASYLANFPETIVDPSDIRTITAASIRAQLHPDDRDAEIDVLEGSPPCASFSTAGKRAEHWGRTKTYSDGAQRTDDLFLEYLRLVDALRPRAFVAENVSGLVLGVAKGWFLDILAQMKAIGYRAEARLLDAQWLGVPQMRRRLIFVGVRDDLQRDPVFPTPDQFSYTLRDALPWVTARGDVPSPIEVREGLTGNHFHIPEHVGPSIKAFSIGRLWDETPIGGSHPKRFNLIRCAPSRPCPTVTATGGNLGAAGLVHPYEKRKWAILELKRVCAFPPDFALDGSYLQQWERLGRAVPPLMMARVATTLRDALLR